jgi:ATP-dependent DNA helicase RecG
MSEGDALPAKESLTVEFKSDRRRLPDDDLIAAVVAMSNAEGGAIFLGVEDDGTPTGLHATHDPPTGMPAMVANRTVPAVRVAVDVIVANGKRIARVHVPRVQHVVATSTGGYFRRRLRHDGTPEDCALLPHEIPSRLGQLGAHDTTRQPVPNATLDDLDPTERSRLRQFIERNNGDGALSGLPDEELDGALGLTVRDAGVARPSLAGLLLIGTESALHRLVPTHEMAFQVLEREAVRTNEFSRAPLLRAVEWLDRVVAPWNREDEVQVGLFRVSVPRIDRRAFREAIANAFTHRDYTRLGAVHVRIDDNGLVISNPGGFVEGVTLDNLLTTEPRPRNPWLADVLKRLGLTERTGRGVDLIYRGLLRYGRPRPDYSRSDSSSVVLHMPTSAADLQFLRLIVEEENRRQQPLPIDSLIALSLFREQRRVTRHELQRAVQKDEGAATRTLEALLEHGLVQSHGRSRGTTYTLSPQVYAALGARSEYVRQQGFAELQQDQMVRQYVQQNGSVVRSDVMELCRLNKDQATRLLRRLVEQEALVATGQRRWRRYSAGPRLNRQAPE